MSLVCILLTTLLNCSVHVQNMRFVYIIGHYCEWQECAIGETQEMLEMKKEVVRAHGKQS